MYAKFVTFLLRFLRCAPLPLPLFLQGMGYNVLVQRTVDGLSLLKQRGKAVLWILQVVEKITGTHIHPANPKVLILFSTRDKIS
ncbi:MAG: hypothetical protein LDLANPLL_01293 [Turneriella sp.]|nr:hypothetical protein [Turneriella sp.]